MNSEKRQFNPLQSRVFRYSQNESDSIIYSGNWVPVLQSRTISSSTWTLISGSAIISNESESNGVTSATISSSISGENTIKNTVTLSDGQILSRFIKLRVIDDDEPWLNNDYNCAR